MRHDGGVSTDSFEVVVLPKEKGRSSASADEAELARSLAERED